MKTKQANRYFFEYDGLERFDEYIKTYSINKNHPIKIILSFYRGHLLDMLRACLFLVAQRSPVWVIPLVTANIIDAATRKSVGGLSSILLNLAIAAVFLLQNVFSTYMATKVYAKVNRGIEGSLRNALVRKLQQLSILFHKEIKSGRLQSKIMRDVENVQDLLNQIFKTLFFFALDITIAVSITLYRSPIVFLFFIVVVPVAVLAIYSFRRPISERNREFRSEVEQTQGAVAEMLEMIPVTRAHGLQEVEIRKMGKYLNQIVNSGYQLDLINALFGAVSWVVFQGFQLLCLGFTGILAFQGKIGIGEVVLYQTYFAQIVGQISTLLNIYPNLCKGVESVKSIGDIISETNVEKNNSIIPLGKLRGSVEFCNVDFKYPDSSGWLLSNFCLKVREGESIAFVGESGAGKSTLLSLLIGFVQPQNGRILIDGINMLNLDMNEYRSQIAVVPQNTILFSGTIKENIMYGLDGITENEINSVINEVGLDDLLLKMPEGLETQLGQHGDKLSGGQRQRISIARALIRHPKIIIFDEATSALDSVSEQKVQDATNRMMRNCTTFMVAHRLSTIRNADRIVVISNGGISEIGNYEELMAQKGAFYHLKTLQE